MRLSHRQIAMLLAATVAIIASPMVVPGADALFVGTDNQAVLAIETSHPDYQPWLQPLWKPPGNAFESLLFSLQAAIGAGVLGYVIGRRHSARLHDEEKEKDARA